MGTSPERWFRKKKGTLIERPPVPASGLGFGIGFGLVLLRLAQNDAVAERQGVELNCHARAFAVRERHADLRPDRLFAFAFLDAVGDQGRLVAHGVFLSVV